MRMAIAKAKEGIAAGQTPFGACIVKDGRAVACAHNKVWKTTDITAHAEIVAIREACLTLGTIDLKGCVIYSTCEPCPMCFSACHWAKLDGIVFGTRVADAQAIGFSELTLSNEEMKQRGQSTIEIVGDYLRSDSAEIFKWWQSRPGHQTY